MFCPSLSPDVMARPPNAMARLVRATTKRGRSRHNENSCGGSAPIPRLRAPLDFLLGEICPCGPATPIVPDRLAVLFDPWKSAVASPEIAAVSGDRGRLGRSRLRIPGAPDKNVPGTWWSSARAATHWIVSVPTTGSRSALCWCTKAKTRAQHRRRPASSIRSPSRWWSVRARPVRRHTGRLHHAEPDRCLGSRTGRRFRLLAHQPGRFATG
jgi:hypothetical protein